MPRLIDDRKCPHCKAVLPKPMPRSCPECAGSLQQRYPRAGCLSAGPVCVAGVIGLAEFLQWAQGWLPW